MKCILIQLFWKLVFFPFLPILHDLRAKRGAGGLNWAFIIFCRIILDIHLIEKALSSTNLNSPRSLSALAVQAQMKLAM